MRNRNEENANKKMRMTALLLGFGWIFLSPAYGGSNVSLTLDGLYSRHLSGLIGHENGSGGSLMLEFQPIDSFSIGLGLDVLDYWGVITPVPVLVESVNLVSRFILNPGDACTFYLIGGGGIRPNGLFGAYIWTGDFHLMGGLGTWIFLNPQLAVDFSGLYDYYNSTGNPLQSVQVRLGLSCFFANSQKGNSQTTVPLKVAAGTTPVITTLAAVPATHTSTALPTPVPPLPIVEMQVEANVANSKKGIVKKAVFNPKIKTRSAINSWKFEIMDPKGHILKAYQDKGVPPQQIIWNGRNRFGKIVPNGIRAIYRLTVLDGKGQKITATGPIRGAESRINVKPVTAVKASSNQGEDEVLTMKGDSLWDTAARASVYGDPELYPLLVDANRKTLKPNQYSLPTGMKIVVPRSVTAAMNKQARLNAWKPQYKRFQGRGLSHVAYQRWRVNHGLSSTWQDPLTKGGKP